MRKYVVFVYGGALMLAGTKTFAQTELDPVTITATMRPATASATGRNIVVIKGEQIAKLPVNSLDELLRYLPGIEVQMRGPMGAQSDIVLRGGTFQQVLVIVDGMRINDPNTGHFNSYIPIAPAEIDRIEILKGASSAIYGSEAVGGVIQVITRSFAAKRGAAAKHLSAQGTKGEYGLWNGQLGGSYQNKGAAFSAGVVSNNADGQPQRGTRGYFHNNTVSASMNAFLSEHWNLAVRTSYDSRDFAAQNFYTTFASDTAKEKVTTKWNQAQLNYAKDNNTFSLNVGYKQVQDRYKYNSAAIANANNSDLLQALALYSFQASKTTSITAGSQWIKKMMESNDRGDHHLNQVGTFVVLNQKVGEHFNINPAARMEWNEVSGWQLVPQVNLSYRLPSWQFRGSAGKTTRDADFTERYNNYNKPIVTSGSIGNPDLDPEKSFSYEAGTDFYGIKNFRVGGTFFQQRFSDLIDYVPTPYALMPRKKNLSPAGSYALAKNIAKVTSTGGELDLQYSKQFSKNQQLWATTGLTWIDTKGDNATPSFYVSSHARFIANFNVQYSYKQFSASVNGLYKKRNEQKSTPINAQISGDYFVLNAMVQAFVYKNKLSIYGQLDNVLDKSYSDLLGSQMPGRWLMAGFKVAL